MPTLSRSGPPTAKLASDRGPMLDRMALPERVYVIVLLPETGRDPDRVTLLQRQASGGRRLTPVFSSMLLATTFLDRAQQLGQAVPLDYIFPASGTPVLRGPPRIRPGTRHQPGGVLPALGGWRVTSSEPVWTLHRRHHAQVSKPPCAQDRAPLRAAHAGDRSNRYPCGLQRADRPRAAVLRQPADP